MLFIFLVNTNFPTQELLSNLAMRLRTKDWRWLGRALGLTESDLEQVEHKEKDLAEICYQMLLKWQQAKGSQATCRELKTALSSENVGRDDLAEIVGNSLHQLKCPS